MSMDGNELPSRTALTAEDVIALLDLQQHPEGGWYIQTFRDALESGARAHSTAIYYLLSDLGQSEWHKIDAAEVWHWYGGAPLELSTSADGETVETMTLGMDLAAGQRPQAVIPTNHWQRAQSLGVWTLVGCTVAPGFEFAGFELAPKGWSPKGSV